MISRRHFLCALPALLVPGERLFASQERAISLVYHLNIPPYSFQTDDPQKPVSGILIDLIDALQPQLNIKFRHYPYPWKRAQLMVSRGKADAFCCPVTNERQQYALFAPTPVTTLREPALFFNPKNPNAEKIRAVQRRQELFPFTAATFFGNSSHEEIWQGHPNVVQVPRVEQILSLLIRGRVDFYFADPIVTGFLLKQMGLAGQLESISLAHIIGHEKATQMRFGLRRSYPDSEQVITEIDTAIQQRITPELHAAIVGRYI